MNAYDRVDHEHALIWPWKTPENGSPSLKESPNVLFKELFETDLLHESFDSETLADWFLLSKREGLFSPVLDNRTQQ